MKLKWLPLLMASSVGAMSAQAESESEVELLVGSYTQGKSQGIYRLQFDSDKGRITPQPLQVFKTDNPSWLTLSKDQQRLFVVNENGQGQADIVGRVSSLAIDPKTNRLSAINQVKTLGKEPTHSSLSSDERYLFVANYGVHADPGGSLAVLPISAQGELQPVTQMSSHPASRVNPERQMSAHVHSVVSSPMVSLSMPVIWARTRCLSTVTIRRPTPSTRWSRQSRPPSSCQRAAVRVTCCSPKMASTRT